MKHLFKFSIYSFALALLVTSCSDDDDFTPSEPLGDYENGYFILHEGGGLITPVTYVDEDGTVEQNVFENVNPTADPIGAFKQDLFFDDTRAFIVSGGGQTVTVLNRYTFEFIATVTTDLINPRYGAVYNNKAYVTNSGDFGTSTDDFVTIIDLTDYSTTTIVIGKIAERIEAANGKLYIANGSFGSGNSVTVLDPSNLGSMTTIDLGMGNSPNSLEADDGFLYVLSGNSTSNGKVFKINLSDDAIDSSIDLPATLTSPRHLDIDGNTIYFTNSTSVYSFATGSTAVSDVPVMTYVSTSQFGSMYGFSARNNVLYIADAGDFASAGTAYEYDTSGNLLNTITTDVAPNSFHFN
ncbi:DUF5074 domain-containing protein [Winogradskyella luteola]|uniref:YncE family protein n=1 Tax=Winogradskyella luteola TaxID=2828330 RepID=A0A9X1F596_9FLAO|nr:DUF5074 domain-containing protein [Winogradskyella luteola]MBV7267645.1 YncE family protein [Winogradskyella luteola]